MRSGRTTSAVAVGFLLILSAGLSSCFSDLRDSFAQAPRTPFRPPVPTKDDVALVEGEAFTISEYVSIQSKLKAASKENVFWVGVAIHSLGRESGGRLAPDAGLDLARYALGEISTPQSTAGLQLLFPSMNQLPASSEAKKAIDRVIAKMVVQRNPQVLAELQ